MIEYIYILQIVEIIIYQILNNKKYYLIFFKSNTIFTIIIQIIVSSLKIAIINNNYKNKYKFNNIL